MTSTKSLKKRKWRMPEKVLVAMSGITTGNAPIYDADPTA